MMETFISSRLTPGGRWASSDGRAVAEIAETDMVDGRGAPVYEWTLLLDGKILGRADDMAGWETDFLALLNTLSSFLTAWDEAANYPNSENADLFPDECEPWLAYVDEFWMDTNEEEPSE